MKKIVAMIAVLSLLFSNASIVSATSSNNATLPSAIEPSIISDSAVVLEASTGAILYEKNMNKKHYPASITKILTTLLALENSSMKDTVTFSKKAVFDTDLKSSRIGIDVGEELTMEQSLYGIMLESANEVSYAVAEHVSGDVDSFTKLMNETATSLGATNTNFVNPNGLPNDNHYTTAHDMALIAREAILNDTFRKIVSTRTYTIPPTNIQSESRPLANSHRFSKTKDYYDGGIGGKTGYTTVAKHTLVSYAERNGMTLVCVLLYCDSSDNLYKDTTQLFDYVFDNYSIHNISELSPETSITAAYTSDTNKLFTKYSPLFSDDNTRLRVEEDSTIILPNNASLKDATADITFHDVEELIEGPNIIGEINYTLNETYVGSSKIIYDFSEVEDLLEGSYVPASTTASTPTEIKEESSAKLSKSKLVLIVAIICILIIITAIYIIFVELPYKRRRRSYLKKRGSRRRNSIDF